MYAELSSASSSPSSCCSPRFPSPRRTGSGMNGRAMAPQQRRGNRQRTRRSLMLRKSLMLLPILCFIFVIFLKVPHSSLKVPFPSPTHSPGSEYRSPQLFDKLWPLMRKDNSSPFGNAIMYDWSWRRDNQDCVHSNNISPKTVVDWYNFCRNVCAQALLKNPQKIGGPGKIVEIDESKFGKRKYNKGKAVQREHWVFGGVERGSNNMFFVSIPDRKKETLVNCIYNWIEPGTHIYSDMWKAYDSEYLRQLQYDHKIVNHSLHFKDLTTGVHTNTMESTWRAVKAHLPKNGTSQDLHDFYLLEYAWRRKYTRGREDAFQKLVEHIIIYGSDSIE